MADRTRAAGWVFLALTAAVLVVQAVSLYERGRKGESDVGVFYRTTQLLRDGAGGEIYSQRDTVTGWPISIPPAGTTVFQPLAALEPGPATVLWALFNLGISALAVWSLRRVLEASNDTRLAIAYPWIAGVFLVLAGGSLQVGQYSLLFVACWVFALHAAVKGARSLSALMWAVPSAIKLYPLLMLATPVSVSSSWSRTIRLLSWFAVWSVVLVFAVPSLFYGLRIWDLNVGFFEEIVLDPGGRLSWMQALGTTANQSLDAVLIRYLSWYPKFHEQYTSVPTLAIELDMIRIVGHFIRVVVLSVTVYAVVRFRSCSTAFSFRGLLLMAAAWSSTLYMMLPETRSRYAVYAFLGFVPFALLVIGAKNGLDRVLRVAAFAVVLLLILGLMPNVFEVWGVGFLAALVLWVVNLACLKHS